MFARVDDREEREDADHDDHDHASAPAPRPATPTMFRRRHHDDEHDREELRSSPCCRRRPRRSRSCRTRRRPCAVTIAFVAEDQPGDDAGEVAVAEAAHDVLEQSARRRVAGAELRERVALQPGDRAGDHEREPDRRARDLAGGAEQREDAGADHRADADERGLPHRQVRRCRSLGRGVVPRSAAGHRSGAEGGDEDRLDRVQPVLGLVEHDARGRLEHLAGDLEARRSCRCAP